jgi:hypothetical protein
MNNLCLAAYDERGELQMIVCGPRASARRSLTMNTSLPYVELEYSPSSAQHYVHGDELVDRPDMPIVATGLVIKGVPTGACIRIEDKTTYVADGTDVELSFNTSGTFKVVIELWPYKTKELYIENPPLD